ncbi:MULTISPECIES: type II toxin-antitoxin system RelE/ParE family toxin [Brevibacillus]|uniref:Type II toxin-antitoxin system RelE/ParE family toxin n=1 Tax=Brevibacillus invocatus TaxID=173959 RepID=A0A3M8BYV0_9BACL|nr:MULTISPECIES: type II toxin-antitoxin system RelE/ParE family toxin [Brevibacillus]MCM3081541.1 type II toxin-antitoxin system RelE/ParE family toxin [Brevibacillus invocatus]MCM3431890.1 type II toxin-antitoxin system RelE/ParE family toxin [Brevibacillus invocatus]MDH4618678.1 type II toxin-antitoxin system RelE/ParE family toxin [Brevibacillus sp. AY1]RNB68514.1 type II toxin-antitoxin system RelE/ParE family toxin [Brevibacillus invocatus]
MTQRNKVVYSPAAIDDMDEIFSFLTQENVSAADHLLQKLDHRISSLVDFPNMGSVLSEDEYSLIQRGYRFIVVHPYLIFYRIMEDTVVIHRILHGRRDYLRELFGSFE